MGVLHTLRFIVRHPIGGKHPVRALVDWARWQVGSRIAPGPIVVPWIAGTRLVVTPGMTGATGNIYVGLHEAEDMAFALHYLRPGDLMVDVGANVGSYTVLAAGAAGARVIACEPVPTTFAALATNVAVNALGDRVELQPVGVGASAGELVMTAGGDTTNHVLRDGERADETVRVVVKRLDDIVGDRAPALVKVDVEGFEREVLSGGGATLTRCGAAIVEVSQHHAEVLAMLARCGLTPVSYALETRRLEPRSGLEPARGNTLFVRDLAEARQRVTSARRFDVKGQAI